MTSCLKLGKDTSVCVRFLTDDETLLKPWKEKLGRSLCHVHMDSIQVLTKVEQHIKMRLDSSPFASVLLLLDTRVEQIFDPLLINLVQKAKKQGVFIGIFSERKDQDLEKIISSFEPNWVLPIKTTREKVQTKVNEILGVIQFSKFPIKAKNTKSEPRIS